MARSNPTSVRWTDPTVRDRVHTYAAHHPGASVSTVVSNLVDEGLRMREHPGITFRDGPMGRRAALAAGSDVWEVIRSLRDAKADEPDLADDDRVSLVATNGGLTNGQVQTAVDYYLAYPDDVDRMVREADAAEDAALDTFERSNTLLS